MKELRKQNATLVEQFNSNLSCTFPVTNELLENYLHKILLYKTLIKGTVHRNWGEHTLLCKNQIWKKKI